MHVITIKVMILKKEQETIWENLEEGKGRDVVTL